VSGGLVTGGLVSRRACGRRACVLHSRKHISETKCTFAIFTKFLCTYRRGSVLLWQHCHTLYLLPIYGSFESISVPLQRVTSLRRRAQIMPLLRYIGCVCPRRRRAPRLDESIVQEEQGAEPAVHHCLVHMCHNMS